MKAFIYLALIALVIFGIYRYFSLHTNQEVQESIKDRDFKTAEATIRSVIADQMQAKAKQYLYENNNYFISKSNNLCLSAQSLFAGLEKITTNPVECVAQVHSFTARIKRIGQDSYYCADAKGFYTIAVTEEGYRPGVACK